MKKSRVTPPAELFRSFGPAVLATKALQTPFQGERAAALRRYIVRIAPRD
jgi:hypothetical protein